MTIVEVALNQQNKKCSLQQYRQDIIEGLSKNTKSIDMKYLYSEKGWQIWAEILKTRQYYVMKAEQQILKRQGSQILSLIKADHFGFVDIGAGNGLKTIPFIQQSLLNGKQVEYIGIDMSLGGNLLLKQKILQQFDTQINATVITSEFSQGLQWVGQYKSLPLFYFFIGITIGNFQPEERHKFLSDVYSSMKKGDMFMITFDQKKDPSKVQKAYFNEHNLAQKWFLASIDNLNTISDNKVPLQNFWSHVLYDPLTGLVEGSVVSKIDQQICIMGNEFRLEQNQVIKMFRSERFSLRQFKEIMQKIGFKYLQYFADPKDYGMACVFTKM